MNNNELMHYGILGMKWGVRRYQNPDGTLTAEGKRKYGKLGESYSKLRTAKKNYSKSYSKAYRYSSTHPISQYIGKTQRKKSNDNWAQAYKDGVKANEALKRYRKEKQKSKRSKSVKNISDQKVSSSTKLIKNGKARVTGLITGAITGLSAKSLGYGDKVAVGSAITGYALGRSRSKFNDEMHDYYVKNHIIKK